MYSKQEKERALQLYDRTGSVSAVVQRLEYPTREELYRWIYERKIKNRKKILRRYKNTEDHPIHPDIDLKIKVLHRCFESGESIESVSEETGYSRQSIYAWRRKYLQKGLLTLVPQKDISRGKIMANYKTTFQSNENPDVEKLKKQMKDLQLEVDILKETIKIIKKDPGINLTKIKNSERTEVVDALKSKYSLSLLLQKLSMAKSSYYYQKNVQKKASKYTSLRKTINRIFSDNYQSYGYRRIKIELNKSGIFTSEKVIRKLMKEEKLYIVHTENHPYSSYKGEITTAAPDLIKHNFHADAPNAKWLTDITQMIIPAGKMYLSAIVDCFDGLVVSWELGTTPTAALADRTLDKAVSTLRGEHPIIHSDRGCHYRWNSWLKRIKTYSLRRSMSRKGCSPDNAACEEFWGRLKNECFYGRSFKHFSTMQFSAYINRYIQWYNCKRVKVSLNGNSPMEYRLLRGA